MGRRRTDEERTPPSGRHGTWRARRLYAGGWRIEVVRRPNSARVLSDAAIARAAQRALEAASAPSPATIGIVLTNDDELEALNRLHMGEDHPTDVLSFPLLPPELFVAQREGRRYRPAIDPALFVPPGSRLGLGDVVISVERAIAQAEQGRGGQTGDVRWSPADELRLLVTHGVLHVCGWDHAEPTEEAAMRSIERELLAD